MDVTKKMCNQIDKFILSSSDLNNNILTKILEEGVHNG